MPSTACKDTNSSRVLDTPPDCSGCGGSEGLLASARLRTIDERASQGCASCHFIRNVVKHYSPGLERDQCIGVGRSSGIHEVIFGYGEPDPLRISVYGHDDPSSTWLSYKQNTKGSLPTHLPEIIGDSSSPAALALVKKWILDCDLNHGSGCKQNKPSLLPTRVLDVGSPDEEFVIRLYETSNEAARYIFLSHCWGDANLFKTETDSLLARTQQIDWNDLPKTFQDAVAMTRALGIRYLWIDSLCIIQDDEDDWRDEAAKMHEIYRNGYLTIAASKSKGPNGGLFAVASPDYRLKEWHMETQETKVQTRRIIEHFEASKAFPLMQRGWVFQERVLSRRILHFGSPELIWECMQHQECECSLLRSSIASQGWKKNYLPASEDGVFGSNFFTWWKVVKDYSALNLTFEKDIFPALSGLAEEQMEAYSALNLTFEKDIFPALSGLAEEQMEARDCLYIAGLWQDSLLYDLMWYIPHPTPLMPGMESHFTRAARPSTWRAPTWSWASVKSGVEYDTYQGLAAALVVEDFDITPGGESVTGELDGCVLIVAGEMASVTIHRRVKETLQLSDPSFRSSYFRLDGEEIDLLRFYDDYDLWSESEHQIHEGQSVRLLYIGKVCGIQKEGLSLDDGPDELRFLVLNQDGEEPDEYYLRIGMAVVTVDVEKPPPEFLDSLVRRGSIFLV